jgi:hypothetical protein
VGVGGDAPKSFLCSINGHVMQQPVRPPSTSTRLIHQRFAFEQRLMQVVLSRNLAAVQAAADKSATPSRCELARAEG